MKAEEVPMDAFLKLTHFPIVIFYGDYIPKTPTRHPHNDYWRAASEMADLFATAVNRHGGDAKVIRLPDVGIYGNSHFPFAERNNQEVAQALKAWLSEKKLDGCRQTMWLIAKLYFALHLLSKTPGTHESRAFESAQTS